MSLPSESLLESIEILPFHVSYTYPVIEYILEEENEQVAVKTRRENFKTVGLSTYLDGYNSIARADIQSSNDFMLQLFRELYEYQLYFFENLLKEPCKYMDDMPLPGFHVFTHCEEFERPVARPHVDVPFNKYDWGSKVGHSDIFTHVIPVIVPEGASMDFWNLTAMDMHKRGANVVVEEARMTEPVLSVEHRKDQLVKHTGHHVHRIAPFKGPTDTPRITMQSHAVFIDGAWQFYW